MKITNLLEKSNPKYNAFYGIDYFGSIETHGNLLRSEDQWPALCYVHGIYNPPEFRDLLLQEELEYIREHRKRIPQSILEIGSGSGQVSCTLSHLGYPVQTTDVNPYAKQFHIARAKNMYNNDIDNDYHLLLGDLTQVTKHINLDQVDTVLLIESIEHIYNDEWQAFLQLALPTFRKNHTHLIITNFKDLWPLQGEDDSEHCNTIDETFFDQLSTLAQRVLLRDRSHLVLEF
jgi:SAM-dependent methyltransferase